MSKLPNLSMEIDQSVGLNETEYLKKPEIELPKSTPVIKEKKKRVVSQKQLDSLKKAREASVAKRKLIKEQKLREKEEAKEAKALSKKQVKLDIKEPMETIEERYGEANPSGADTPEALIDMDKPTGGFDYERVVSSVYDMIQAEKETRRPAKEAKFRERFDDEEKIRIDERNKLLDLVKQMEEADRVKRKPKKEKKPERKFNANHYLSNGDKSGKDINWDNCFAPRRGTGNFF
tara:strand:- start:2208 stop:2909 length:702 start_codon:yes stop_codon:yes gene_type:complete